jgi:hypothetical protein
MRKTKLKTASLSMAGLLIAAALFFAAFRNFWAG